MIYWTFKSVEHSFDYAAKELERAREAADRYIQAVVRENGPVTMTVRSKKTLIILAGKPYTDEEHLVFYRDIDIPQTIDDLTGPELLVVCKDLHEMHLVEEDGDEAAKS